jgi:hypothetical protein
MLQNITQAGTTTAVKLKAKNKQLSNNGSILSHCAPTEKKSFKGCFSGEYHID